MPLPLAAAAIGAVATLGGAAINALSQPDGSSTSGYELPPEYELKLLEAFDQNVTALSKDFTNLEAVKKEYRARLDTIWGAMNATIPSAQAMKSLTSSNMALAQHLGMSADEMVRNGFMDEGDSESLKQLQAIETGGNVADTKLEQQLSDQRARLDQDLRRQGASPAIRAQALAQFDRDAEAQRFGRSQELKTSQASLISNRLQIGSGLRQQGYNIATGALESGLTMQGANQNAIVAAGNINTSGLSGNLEISKQQAELEKQKLGQYQELGKFLLSDRTKSLLSSGQVGPGSVTKQLGLSGKVADTAALSPQLAKIQSSFNSMSDADLQKFAYRDGWGGKSMDAGTQGVWQAELQRRNLVPMGVSATDWSNSLKTRVSGFGGN